MRRVLLAAFLGVVGLSGVTRADPPPRDTTTMPPSRDEDLSVGGVKRTRRTPNDTQGASQLGTLTCKQMVNDSVGTVKVENTSNGVVIRMTAKDPQRTGEVQRVARMMVGCVGSGAER